MSISVRLRALSRRFSGTAGVIAGFGVFAVWMLLVGSPHVVETVLGLVIATAAGALLWFRMRRQ